MMTCGVEGGIHLNPVPLKVVTHYTLTNMYGQLFRLQTAISQEWNSFIQVIQNVINTEISCRLHANLTLV